MNHEKIEYLWFEEKYIIPYLERVDINQLPKEMTLIISSIIKPTVQSYEDISVQLKFQISDELENEQATFNKLYYQYSKHRRDIARKLYSIASNFKMDQRQTIQAIKEVSRFNSSRVSMDYYEIVLNFKEMLEEKVFELPNMTYQLFIDMLIHFAIDYNAATLVDFMNLLELNMYHSSKLTDDNKQYIRNRLLNICEESGLGVEVEVVPMTLVN